MSADYCLPPTPNTSAADPEAKAAESLAYSKAGVDSGEIVIRGGSHLDFSFIPNPAFGATLRGADLIDWYTTAWFDKYVKGDPTADRRLLSDRWRNDALEAAVDPDGDGNAFCCYYRSRLDIALPDGGPFDCEDLRAGCAALRATTATPATTPTRRSTARPIDQRRGLAALTPSRAASTSRRRSTSPRMPATASLKRKASASFTIA